MEQRGIALLMAGCLGAAIGLVPPATADPALIYGTVTTDDGRELAGVISWDGEEVYWLQHFNGRRQDPVDLSALDKATREAILERQPGPQLELGEVTIELVKWFSEPELRPTDFGFEFGAIDRLEVDRGRVRVQLRDGSVVEADGGSNDIGAELSILAADGSERTLDWDEVRTVVFAGAPVGHPAFPPQLFGTATTAHGALSGVLAWDSDERFATEMLDGDDPDGNELSIEFGDIRRIENRGDASLVLTRDGRELILDDSNDVNRQNRGLILVSPSFGRIVVAWEDLEAVDFTTLPAGFLPGREAWEGLGSLRGAVSSDGERLTGELLYDVDERLQADVLDGYLGDSRVWIPLRLVSAVRRGDNRSTVTLTTGVEWVLDRDRDVMDTNNGIVVSTGAERRYLPWEEVSEVRFPDHRPPAAPVPAPAPSTEEGAGESED